MTNTVHLIRYHAYKEITKLLADFSIPISSHGRYCSLSDWRPIISKNFPELTFVNLPYPEFDIQNLAQLPDNSVDIIYSEMILEHVRFPQNAVDEIYRVLKPGGIAIHTTVFIMPFHPSPKDYWRFSPTALYEMHSQFSKVESGGYGNRKLLLAILCRFTRFPVNYNTGNLLTFLTKGNNSKFPIVTYVVAQK